MKILLRHQFAAFSLWRTLPDLSRWKPNPSTVPFNSLTFSARSSFNPQEEVKLTVDGEDLAQGLEYGDMAGLKPLIGWIEGLHEFSHGRKRNEGWRISMGFGSQNLIYKVSISYIQPKGPR